MVQTDAKKNGCIFNCLSRTYRRNGFIGVYKGISSPLFGAIVENSVAFVSYGALKKLFLIDSNPSIEQPNPIWKYLLAGSFSGIAVAFCLTPIELVKCNVQVSMNSSEQLTCTQFIAQHFKTKGIRGFWRGNVPCLLREIPGGAAWFGAYELVRTRLFQPFFQYESLDSMPLFFSAIAGGCAGISYWLIPYPIDTLKSSIQTDSRFVGHSTFSSMRILYKELGLRGLYKGSLVTSARAAVAHGTLFYLYELFYKYSSILV